MPESLTFNPAHIERFKTLVADSRHIVVVAHTNADGDAMGSLLGLCHLVGLRAIPMLPNGCPPTFAWMPGADAILCGDSQRERCRQAFADADLVIGTDFNTVSRTDSLAGLFANVKKPKILLDHHHDPDVDVFDLVFSVPELSSASELVYWVARQAWGDAAVTQAAARCLYTGICTDTGSFSYSCEQPSLYHAAAALVAKDIDAADIHNRINNTFSTQRLLFFGFAISHRLRIFPEQHFAYFYVSLADQREYGIEASDLEGLVNYTLTMKDIEAGALVREEEKHVKLSLRSKYTTDVNKVARTYFGGGGHTKAAGATVELAFEDTIALLEKIFLQR